MARTTFRSFWSFMARRPGKHSSPMAGGNRSGRRPGMARTLPLSLEWLENRWLPSAAIVTDKPDYALGESVQITGTGFQVGETVQLQVLHTDGTSNTAPDHDPWFVTDGGAGDLD